MGRRAMRRRGRRRARRRTRRRVRRRMLLVGGMVVLAAGGTAAAIKLTQKDAQRIEQHTGMSAADLTDEDLREAMDELGIQEQELTDQDRAAMEAGAGAPPPPVAAPPPAAAPAEPEDSYLDELERLADLRDRGIISDEDFEAKKRQLLGL